MPASYSQTVATLPGLGFPEALRWRGEALWFSDMFRGKVMSWEPGSNPITVLASSSGGPVMPGGLGWSSAGELLVVDCLEKLVLKVTRENQVTVHADLSELTSYPLNDMHVDINGVAWVGGYGFDPEIDEPIPSVIYRISPDGQIESSPKSFVFPNGIDRVAKQLAVAETFADQVSFFDEYFHIHKIYPTPSGAGPDGISFSPEGELFVAMAFTGSLEKLSSKGAFEKVFIVENTESEPGGKKGLFDCAVDPSGSTIAVSSACLDEDYSNNHDTGSITILNIS